MNEIQLAVAPSREPQQGRSRASYERLIAAAEKLLRERGSNEFTLQEVSKVGKVSIGSIYNRFDSKDDLVRAVQSRVLIAVDREQREVVEAAEARAGHLHELVPMLIDGIAEALRRHADLMRPMMLQAVSDPVVSEAGKRSYEQVEAMVCAALLTYRSEIRRADPDRAVHAAYRIAYAALARDLGFGAAPGYHVAGEWQALKETLGDMVSAYLGSAT
ncbi:MAG TPA: helix-turn-helix domain-containing protein [Sphingomonas sp.]|uniref:TetR/AcrR family transcriptional regulator n=1 Tax=Sphingomonas sp. TaxID=28214 RepID=UPI002EDB4E1C